MINDKHYARHHIEGRANKCRSLKEYSVHAHHLKQLQFYFLNYITSKTYKYIYII